MAKYNVGDTLYCVYSNRRSPETVTIEKVGRKWLHLSNGYRADIDSLILDGGKFLSSGVCYLNENAYLLSCEVGKQWRIVFVHVYHNRDCPDNVSLDDIEKIRKLLKI